MAADDQSKEGKPSTPGKDARKERAKTLDTQSLRALAPSNEVARSALEMRQNLEKYMPPGEQRDQLIAQLKEDVTPILSPELEAKKNEANLSDAIDRAAEMIRNKLGQFETYGPVREVPGVPEAVVEHLRQVSTDPRRSQGEFQIAIGTRDGMHFSTSRYFESAGGDTPEYNRMTAEGLSDLQVSGYVIQALILSHQEGEGIDPTHFYAADIDLIDKLQTESSDSALRCFLLTPAPENIVIVYSANYKEKLPLGETVGIFTENGDFEVKNDKYVESFSNAKLQVGA